MSPSVRKILGPITLRWRGLVGYNQIMATYCGTTNRGPKKVMVLTSITIVLEYKLACWPQMYAWYYGWLTATASQLTHR
jgi:hypothetical protein